MVASPLWTDRTDERAKDFNYEQSPKLTAEEVAETMIRMIEEGKYAGGTVVLKSVGIEEVVFDPKNEQQDLLSAQADMGHIKGLLSKERGSAGKS